MVSIQPNGAYKSMEIEEDTSSSFSQATRYTPGFSVGYMIIGKPDGTYYYRARGIGYDNNPTPWTDAPAPCTVLMRPAPAYVQVPAASATGSFPVMWGVPSGATGVELQQSFSPGFESPQTYSYPSSIQGVTVNSMPNGTAYYRVRGEFGTLKGPWTEGANGCTITVSGTFRVNLGSASPPPTSVLAGTTGVSVLQLEVVCDYVESITVDRVSFQTAGTLADDARVDAAYLCIDVDRDGLLSPGDFHLSGPETIAADNGVLSFTGLSRTFPPNTGEAWIVVYDISSAAQYGETFSLKISSGADLDLSGSITSGVQAAGLPVVGSQRSISDHGSLHIAVDSSFPVSGIAHPQEAGAVILPLKLTTGQGEGVHISTLILRACGSAETPSEWADLCLYEDSNGNRSLDDSDALLRGPVPVAGGSNLAIFWNLGRVIPENQSRTWFVTATVLPEAPLGSSFALSLIQTSDVVAWGDTWGAGIQPTGLPLAGIETLLVPGAEEEDSEGEDAPEARGGCRADPFSRATPTGVLGTLLLMAALVMAVRFCRRPV